MSKFTVSIKYFSPHMYHPAIGDQTVHNFLYHSILNEIIFLASFKAALATNN
jgi:hypothetical protein